MRSLIGVIQGEGIGPDIMRVALACLAKVELVRGVPLTYRFYEGLAPTERPRDATAYRELRRFYGEVREDDGVILRSSIFAALVYRLREDFNLLYKIVCFEPLPELRDQSRLREDLVSEFRIALIRDNTQGPYHAQEEQAVSADGGRRVTIKCAYDETKIAVIARAAFDEAQRRRRKLHLLLKGHVFSALSDLWLSVFADVGRGYPEVMFDWEHPDPGLADLVGHPDHYDVVVTLDVEGDIAADVLAELLYGSRYITPSANVDPLTGFGSFQTVHGSADELVGKDQANPIGMVMAVAMMLDRGLGRPSEAEVLRSAVRKALGAGCRTADMVGGVPGLRLVGTEDMGQAIADAIQAP